MPAVPPRAEARRNLEILMFHDPAKVDGVAIHMQILTPPAPGRAAGTWARRSS